MHAGEHAAESRGEGSASEESANEEDSDETGAGVWEEVRGEEGNGWVVV